MESISIIKGDVVNQFVLGFQRQADVLIDAQYRLALIEIKLAKNKQNPFDQVLEYLYYCLSSFRLYYNRSKAIETIDLVALLEDGNRYLSNNAIRAFSRRCAEIGDKEKNRNRPPYSHLQNIIRVIGNRSLYHMMVLLNWLVIRICGPISNRKLSNRLKSCFFLVILLEL